MFVRLVRWWGVAVAVAVGQVSAHAHLFLAGGAAPTNAVASSNLVTLAWNPSPDLHVTGYFLFAGLASGQCTNRLVVGSVTNATVGGLETNVTYYFTVIAHDGIGLESPPSNEVSYQVPATAPPAEPPRLNFAVVNPGSPGAVLRLSLQGRAGRGYAVQATTDFREWTTVWITNCASDGLIVFNVMDMAKYPHRFFRLKAGPPALELALSGAGSTGAVLRLSFPGSAGTTYAIQATSDFQNWTTLWTTNCAASGLIVYEVTDVASHPRRFFRLLLE